MRKEEDVFGIIADALETGKGTTSVGRACRGESTHPAPANNAYYYVGKKENEEAYYIKTNLGYYGSRIDLEALGFKVGEYPEKESNNLLSLFQGIEGLLDKSVNKLEELFKKFGGVLSIKLNKTDNEILVNSKLYRDIQSGKRGEIEIGVSENEAIGFGEEALKNKFAEIINRAGQEIF